MNLNRSVANGARAYSGAPCIFLGWAQRSCCQRSDYWQPRHPRRPKSCLWSACLPRPISPAPTLRGVKISPDGRLVAYLRARDDDKDRFDLWAFDVRDSRDRLLVDSRTLAGADRALSAEEEARRERQRTSAYSGIVEYSFAPDSRHLLIPLNGDLYVYDLARKPARRRAPPHQHRRV